VINRRRACLLSISNLPNGEADSPLSQKEIPEFWDSTRVEDIMVYSTQDSREKVCFLASVLQFELQVQKFSHYRSLIGCSG